MGWEIRRIVNEEGLTILGPYKTRHMAELRADQDRARLAYLGYELVWYEFVEIKDGTPECVKHVPDGELPTQVG
jgi:hypothetical protein